MVGPAADWTLVVQDASWASKFTVSSDGNLAYISHRYSRGQVFSDLTVKDTNQSFKTLRIISVSEQMSNWPSFSPDGRLLLLDSVAYCKIWDTRTWVSTNVPYPRDAERREGAFGVPLWSSDSTTCLVSYDGFRDAYVLDALAMKFYRASPPFRHVQYLGITRHHLYVATPPWDSVRSALDHPRTLLIDTYEWRRYNCQVDPVRGFYVHSSRAQRLAFVPIQNAVLGYGTDALSLWNATTGELLWTTGIPHDLRSLPVRWDRSTPGMDLGIAPNKNVIAIMYPHTIIFLDAIKGAITAITPIDPIGFESVQEVYLTDERRVLVRYPRSFTATNQTISFVIEEYDWE